MEIGEKLKAKRLEANLTQEQVAEALSVSRAKRRLELVLSFFVPAPSCAFFICSRSFRMPLFKSRWTYNA